MYLLNTPTQIDWILEKTTKIVLLSDLFIITKNTEKDFSYAPIENLIAPTFATTGLVTHLFTPDAEGLWELILVKGSSTAYVELDKVEMQVFSNITEIKPLTYEDGSLDLIAI